LANRSLAGQLGWGSKVRGLKSNVEALRGWLAAEFAVKPARCFRASWLLLSRYSLGYVVTEVGVRSLSNGGLTTFDSSSLLKEEYVALRAEICQSIAQQNRILLTGYAASATTVGIVLGSSTVGPKPLVVVPLILLAMIALWGVECNRMVRASCYISYVLWPELCKIAGPLTFAGWESWIRTEKGKEGEFRLRQHRFQLVAVVYVPMALSIAAVIAAASATWQDGHWLWPIVGFGALLLIALVIVFALVLPISDLGASRKS
jgi:hypothetical protein